MVPNITQVRFGAAVSIVLKQDQPTGRQVQGIVSDVLTKGNHPRGIKVRLQDGRIGRVQQMARSTIPTTADAVTLQQDLDAQAVARDEGTSRASYRSGRLAMRYTDVRNDQHLDEPAAELDLMSFVKPAKVKKGAKKPRGDISAGPDSSIKPSDSTQGDGNYDTLAKCPVCNDFEGDEAAVAHHVETHFT